MSGCLRRKALEAAVADTVILAEIAINGFETVVGCASRTSSGSFPQARPSQQIIRL